jgi:hypothetical protein
MLDSAAERPSGVDGLEPAVEVRSAIERYRDAVNRHVNSSIPQTNGPSTPKN